jgi:hypothetical protein
MDKSLEQANLYAADIPTQGPFNTVYYYIQVSNDEFIVTSPAQPYEYSFGIEASEESITSSSELIAMVIMMIIIMGFFWGGFGYTSFIAMKAEQRKLHEYYYGE